MSINQVSFGKAIKINGSKEIAQQLLDLRKDNDSPFKFIVNGIIGEEGQDEIILESNKNESYIFTGEDAISTQAFICYSSNDPNNLLYSKKMLDIAYDTATEKSELKITSFKKDKDQNGEIKLVINGAEYKDISSKKSKFKFNFWR